MSMIQPPIDDLANKATGGNKYKLSNGVALRAKKLEKRAPLVATEPGEKNIPVALREVYEGKIEIKDEQK